MNISYNWLKEYVNFDLTPDETAAALTSIGLALNTLTLIIYTLRLSTWETANRYKSFAEPRMWLPDKK